MVGCVLAREGPGGEPRVVGVGHHRRFGGIHAERDALADCAKRGEPGGARGSTAYVTLEPCNGHGKQPPCVEALIEAGVVRVVFAERDPSATKGGGSDALARTGIVSRQSLVSAWASRLSAPWRKHLATGLPWVIVKWAQTIDGRVATGSGDSKWISAEPSRRMVHALRGRVDAVLTGVGTVLTDDPLLDCRVGVPRTRAVRVVVDSNLRTPLESRLLKTVSKSGGSEPGGVVIACTSSVFARDADRVERFKRAGVSVLACERDPTKPCAGTEQVDLADLLRRMASQHHGLGRNGSGVQTVLVEAGPRLIGSLLRASLVDEIVAFTAPFALPDSAARPASESTSQQSPFGLIHDGRGLGTFRPGLARLVRGCDDMLTTWWRDPNNSGRTSRSAAPNQTE